MSSVLVPAPLHPRTRYGGRTEADGRDGFQLDESPRPARPTPDLVETAEKLIGDGRGVIEVATTTGLSVPVVLPIVRRVTRKTRRKPAPAKPKLRTTAKPRPTSNNLPVKKLEHLADRIQVLAGHHQAVARDLLAIVAGIRKGGAV